MTDGPHADVVDAHVHVGLEKYGPIDEYVATMDRIGLRHGVLVQYQWNSDNSHLTESLARFPGRFAVVGVVDLASPSAPDVVAGLARLGARGIRLPPRSLAETPGIWSALSRHGLVASVTGPFEEVIAPAFAAGLARYQDVWVRLEHLGGRKHGDPRHAGDATRRFIDLARFPRTTTMWSGFWLNAPDDLPYTSAHDVLLATLDAFGPERITWSGDWNRPRMTDARYVAEIDLVASGLGLSTSDAAAVLGGTARRLFGLS